MVPAQTKDIAVILLSKKVLQSKRKTNASHTQTTSLPAQKDFENQSEKQSKTIPFYSARIVRSRGHYWPRSENFDKSMRNKQIRFHFIATS
jgi:hypothetical protein